MASYTGSTSRADLLEKMFCIKVNGQAFILHWGRFRKEHAL
jgi:hypothetical protein